MKADRRDAKNNKKRRTSSFNKAHKNTQKPKESKDKFKPLTEHNRMSDLDFDEVFKL